MRHFVELGKVARPHGFRGEFVVQSHGGADSALSYVQELFIGKSETSLISFRIVEAAWMPRGWKIKLQGIETQEAVSRWQGLPVFAPRSELKPTVQNEYYLADLEGATVKEWPSNKSVGTFLGAETISPKTADRWWVEVEGKRMAVPAIRHFVARVDPADRIIYIQNLGELE